MSNRQLEELQEAKFNEQVAAALGISVADLSELDWIIDENTTHDGAVSGYNISFAEGSDPEVLGQIPGVVDGRWIRIGLI